MDELDQIIYFQNGELNTPYVLANAGLLLKSDEPRMAAILYMVIARHKKNSFCGFYGLGQCFLALEKPQNARDAFRKAFLLGGRPYMAVALIEALLLCEEYAEAEALALKCAVEFVTDAKMNERFKNLYQRAAHGDASQVSTVQVQDAY